MILKEGNTSRQRTLKDIEEPPSPKTIFLLSTSNISRIPNTIFSRCRHIQLQTPQKKRY